MAILSEKEENILKKVEEFLKEHGEDYDDFEKEYILKAVLQQYKNGFQIDSLVSQILSYIGELDDGLNMYKAFADLLEEKFDIDGNIVEVAGGTIPELSRIIALRQKKGTITIYDPRVIKPKDCPGNLILKRQQFSKDTELPTGTNLVIAFMPCEAAMDTIEAACANQTDFMVAMCEGGDRGSYGYLETDEEWLGMAKYIAEQGVENNNLGTVETTYLKRYNNPYPIYYNKR